MSGPTTKAGQALLAAIAEHERLSLNGARIAGYIPAILAIERDARNDALDAVAAAVEGLPATPWYDAPDDDGMCPNCVTPWKCNGPHEPPERDAAGYDIHLAAVIDAINAARPK